MVVLLHGVAGGWDELAIAVAALAVLFLAVKLAGRKSAEDDEAEHARAEPKPLEQDADAKPSSPTKRGS